ITKETITPEGAVLFPLDVTKPDSVSAIVKTILDREKRLDVVLNNAGFGIGGPLETTSLEEAKSQFKTNFFGVHLVNQAVLPYLTGVRPHCDRWLHRGPDRSSLSGNVQRHQIRSGRLRGSFVHGSQRMGS
ncbi:MAG: SDR family NAD(P)-dependent oxidoreductase, partial [FCB group bacterium]|nr:SDR family NAD(P)-dependent oxidoreductase [FCB group bacterium]